MKYELINKWDQERDTIEQVLFNRGLNQEQMERYMNPRESECFSPMLLNHIERAAERLLKALIHQEKVHIQVDSDCDGYTSAALLLNYLYRIFPATVQNNFTYNLHEDKHHGINASMIPEGTTLVIAPDSSSNEVAEHVLLKAINIDVIVLDHHEAPRDLTDPAIIVNNHMCGYPNKGLSGVGIVYKFCKVLDSVLKVSYADDFLDLVALGMVADMMDMRELETRYLTWKGMQQPQNPFIVGMMEKNEYKIQGKLTPFTIGWYVAPFINAMCRSGALFEKRILFQSLLEYMAPKLVPSTKRGGKGQEETILTQALRTAGNVKSHQDDEKKKVLPIIRKLIAEQKLDECSIIIVQVPGEMESTLNGLVANQLMSEYKKPVLVLTKREKDVDFNFKNGEKITDPDKIITWEGSARAYVTAGINNWRNWIADSGFCEYAEGHALAFGVGFTPEKLELFKDFCKRTFPTTPEAIHKVDFIWDYKIPNLGLEILNIAEYKDIWGQGVKEPLVVIKDVPVQRSQFILLNKGTLKILIPRTNISCIKFGYGEEQYNNIADLYQTDDSILKMDILGFCSANEWNGNVTPQIEIQDFQISSSHRWYF